MAKVVTGLFKNRNSSRLAVEDLMRHGYPPEDISVLMPETDSGREWFMQPASKAPEGGVTGTIAGGIAGALIAFLIAGGIMPDPGTGLQGIPHLLATLAGTGVGMLAGLIIGLLVGSFMPEHKASLCSLDSRRGGILLGVYTHPSRANEAAKVIEAGGGTAVRSRTVRPEPLRYYAPGQQAAAGGVSDQDRG